LTNLFFFFILEYVRLEYVFTGAFYFSPIKNCSRATSQEERFFAIIDARHLLTYMRAH